MNPARMKIAALAAAGIAAMTSWATVGPDPSDPTTLLADVAEGDTETHPGDFYRIPLYSAKQNLL